MKAGTILWFPVSSRPTMSGVATDEQKQEHDKAEAEFRLRLGNVLKAIRIGAGITQEYAGEKVGRSADTVGTWERGEHTPPSYVVSFLANLYQASDELRLKLLDPPPVPLHPLADLLAKHAERAQRSGPSRKPRAARKAAGPPGGGPQQRRARSA